MVEQQRSSYKMTSAVSEEEVMRMRLLVDGDGLGDDRRLNMLLKALVKWCNSENEDQSSCEQSYQRMLTQLASIEWSMAKSRQAEAMNIAEQQQYGKVHSKVEQGIVKARAEIEETKQELVEAKLVRKNRMEYDALAKVIQSHPDRDSSTSRLETVREELGQLEEREKQLQEKLETRKKQFHLLVSSIHQMQDLLAEDEDENTQKTGPKSPEDSMEVEGMED